MVSRTCLVLLALCLRSARVDCVLTNSSTANVSDATHDKTEELIAELEATQSKLMEQIQDAVIQDQAMAELLTTLNMSDPLEADNNSLLLDGRRSRRPKKSDFKKDKDRELFDADNLYSKKDRESKKWKERMTNKGIIQWKLDKWLEDRKAEKAKIKAYKDKVYKLHKVKEYCGREGTKTKKKWRRSGSNPKRNKDGITTYPCCRKCCKRSYMGCL